MDLKDKIIEKQDEIIKTLKDYIHVGGQESDYVGYWDKVYKLESELSTLRSQLQDKEQEFKSYNVHDDPDSRLD